MASTQEAIVMNDMEKDVANKQQQNSAAVSMTNSTRANVKFSKSNNWFGQVTGSYPATIASSALGKFTHNADTKNGSKGAVIYLGTNVQGFNCGWLLAWSAPKAPTPNNPNRVYVTCGAAENFKNVNWNQILTKLNTSGDIVNYLDPVTKTAIHANIQPGTNSASVGASFGAV
ncbi:hypothetical protein SOVF_134270 [Spinacia oleracea]|uniref:Jasmonate-induced protein homolog n=1 Tax=Spinacia oleracea TaxID=3562 RepID=A0A9R0IMU4_SPIOL|nr:jasmonate-induced protein homolog [Spinacia oleracea]KNA11535.1 hypothetical protein SOVF_134270 [Spinacia oleracea]